MKIIQVCPRFFPDIGGVETHVYEISKRLAKSNDVYVYTTDPTGKLPKKEVIEGVTVKRFRSFAPSSSYFFSPSLYLALKKERCDVLHSHLYHALPALEALFSRPIAKRLFFTPYLHSRAHTKFRDFIFPFYKPVAKKLFQEPDCIICCSDYEVEIVKSSFSNLSKICVVPLGVDLSKFKHRRKKRGDDRVLLYSGRLEGYKGVQHIIKALSLLKKRDNLKLWIVGDGPFRGKLEILTRNLNLEGSVTFFGIKKGLDEMIPMYFQSDMFVLPSLYESFGIVLIEALASGLKVLSTPVGEAKFLIEKGFVSGLKYPPDAEDIADKISGKWTSKKIGASHLKKYSYESIAKKIEGIYLDKM